MCLFVLTATNTKSRSFRLLSWKPLAFIGTFAYSIYLIHAPLLEVFFRYVINPMHLSPVVGMLIVYFILLPVVVGISYLFFLVAEKPFIKKIVLKPVSKPVKEQQLAIEK